VAKKTKKPEDKPLELAQQLAEIRKSLELYRTVVKQTSLGIALEVEGEVQVVNEAMAELFELPADAPRTSSFDEMLQWVHPEDRAFVVELARQRAAGETGLPTQYELRTVTATGQLKWVQLFVSRFTIDDRSATMVTVADITERRRAQASSAESEKRFQAIFDSVRDGIMLVDIETKKLCLANEAMCQMIGCEPAQITILKVADIHPAEDLPRVVQEFEAQVRGESSLAADIPVKRLDGDVFYADINSVPVNLGDKNYLLGIFRDVTERKQAEEKLRREHERAQQYLDLAPVVFVAIDASGTVTLINQKGCEILGYPEQEIVGKNWFDNFIPDWLKQELLPVSRALLDGDVQSAAYHENPILNSAGEERLIAWHNTTLTDEAGNITGHLSAGEDITERRQLEAELLHAQKMEAAGQLAGGVAHDMNNVLTVVMGAASLLEKRLDPADPSSHEVAAILAACRRGSSLAGNLLGFARKGLPERQAIIAGELVAETVDLLERTIHPGITIDTAVAPDLSAFEGDRAQLGQALMNICLNAVQAIGEQGRLSISADHLWLDESETTLTAGHYLRIDVTDTGEGMSETAIQRAVEPFFTTKVPGEGTGLGLAIVYRVAKDHGGDLRLESRAGHGTKVSLYLALNEPAQAAPEVSEIAPEQTLSGTVLVVDDETWIRQTATRILEHAGCAVLQASNGQEAVDLYRQKRVQIDVVLLDLLMPVMDGGTAFFQLREINPDLPILISSGYAEDDQKIALILEAGFSDCVQKPYTFTQLVSKVGRALRGLAPKR